MNSEKDYLYEVETEVSDLNEDNILKPYAYQKILAKVVEQHLYRLNLNVATTLNHHLSWVLVSLTFELVRPIEGCVKVFANTWYSQRKGPFFRREFIFKNADGEILTRGSSFSVLFDVEKRAIFRAKELPFSLSEPIEEFTVNAAPTFHANLDYTKIDTRKIYNSYIDRIGHVNNCRYGEFGYDAFSSEERENLIHLKRMAFYFLAELRHDDTLSVLKAYENKRILVRGYNESKAKNAFDLVFEFDS